MENKDRGRIVDIGVFSRIIKYTHSHKSLFYGAISIAFIFGFIVPIRPWLTQYMFDHYIVKSNPSMLISTSIALVGLLLFECLLQFLDGLLSNKLGQYIILDLRNKLFSKLIYSQLTFFDKTPIGTLVTRTISDIEVIGDIFSDGLLTIAGDLLKILVIIGVMCYTSLSLTIVSLLTIPLLFIATYLFKNAIKQTFQEVRKQIAQLNAFVQEHITGMMLIQLFNREQIEYEKFKTINANHRDANIRSIFYYSVFFPVVEILASISLGLIVWWGGLGVIQKNVTLGEVIAFIMYINMLFRPIRLLADRFNTLQMGIISAERVLNLIENSDSVEIGGTFISTNIKGNIEFQNVCKSYEKEPINSWILEDISFKISAGETIAIVGETGSGKTSVVNLINRFYEATKGEITLDDIPIKSYNLNELRKNIGMVVQDVFLFSDSIMNNIRLLDNSITEEKVITASKEIGAHDFIMNLPNGYYFNVMERGSLLSMGQRQLIAFIRAYVYDPKILILDEATSSVDSETERLISNATQKIIENRTSIIIAHRLSTIQKADRIIVFEKGKIKESGTHEELLDLNGKYKKLYNLQFASVN